MADPVNELQIEGLGILRKSDNGYVVTLEKSVADGLPQGNAERKNAAMALLEDNRQFVDKIDALNKEYERKKGELERDYRAQKSKLIEEDSFVSNARCELGGSLEVVVEQPAPPKPQYPQGQ